MIQRIENWLLKKLQDRVEKRIIRRYGGIQRCPWCKQWAQLYDGSRFDSETDPTIDALICGNCGGISRWRFEMGMTPLDPIGLKPPPVSCDISKIKFVEPVLIETIALEIQRAVENMPYRNNFTVVNLPDDSEEIRPETLRQFFESTWQGEYADEVFSAASKVAAQTAVDVFNRYIIESEEKKNE